MATYPSVNVNYNVRDNAVAPSYIPSAFIVGVSQRGPCYRVVTITDVNQFLDVFGQPTNKFEYDFFKAVKTTVFSRSIAYCYRIPYSDEEKQLYDAKFRYVLKQTADNLTQLQYDISATSEISDIVDGKEAVFEFTPLNDFESIVDITDEDNGDHNVEKRTIFISDNRLRSISNDIDPEYVIGIMPIFFGAKDVENLYDLKFKDLFYYDKTDITRKQNFIDKFNLYVCDKDNSQYLVDSSELTELFKEFERSNHFTYDWFQVEIGKLIDNLAPKDTDEFRNTMGIAFVEFFFDDQHKLDYKILEAYYGLVGHSTNRYRNLEDQINSRSNFFHIDITGNIDKFTYIQALGDGSLLSNEYVVPLMSPYKPSGIRIIESKNIFDETPASKYDDRYCYSLKTLYDRLVKTEYLNSVPFDYVLSPGVIDIFCLEDQSKDHKTYDGLLPYKRSEFIIDPLDRYDDIDHISTFNIISLNKFLSRLTNLGDKGILALIDIPEVVNQYFKENLGTCYTDSDTKDMVSKVEKFIPDLKTPLGGLYDRTYPLFNYQYVDKDFELTRYKRLELKNERFELIPGSIMVLRAYLRNDLAQNFYPIAGPRSVNNFPICHRSFIDKKDTNLFKVIYDAYGIASLVNDRDNNTFIVQQTTWNQTTSIFKQIHALRIYKFLKRRVLSALYQRIYEPNTLDNRKALKSELQSILAEFKRVQLIDNVSDAFVWALKSDIENNQINCQVVVGIFGAIVKIVLNMNLTSATIDYTES